jgi:hypothetical protein
VGHDLIVLLDHMAPAGMDGSTGIFTFGGIREPEMVNRQCPLGYGFSSLLNNGLPHAFSRLTGLPTRIYQTVHEGPFVCQDSSMHSALFASLD